MPIRRQPIQRTDEPPIEYEFQVEGLFGEAPARPSHEFDDLLPVVTDVLKHNPDMLQWRPAGQALWQVAGDDGPVVQARILTPAQVAEFGARRRRDYQPPDHPNPHAMPAPESFSADYFTSAIFAGAVPSFMDLENGIHALKLFMIGLIDEPRPDIGATTFVGADHFARHCSELMDVLEAAVVDYREAVDRARAVGDDR